MIEKFNVLFIDKNNLPMQFSKFSQNVSVCIGQTLSTYFCNAPCDKNSVAHFTVKNFPDGVYYMRGVWKEGYINFTRPLTIKVENNKIIIDKKEITDNQTVIIKSNF